MLTDVQIRKAKPTDKPLKLTDSGGLHLYVTPSGGRFWRLRYEIARKEKLLSLGSYPEMTLVAAREARDAAKRDLREGRDPGILKKRKRLTVAALAATTFESIAKEWHALQKPGWTPTHAGDVLRSLERDVFPVLGSLPIKDITAPEVLATLREIEGRSAAETARRIRQRMSAVFDYAIASGRAETDPAAIIQGAMAPLIKGKQPAITDLKEAREVLKKVEATPAHPVTKLAMRVLALTSVRPGELRGTHARGP